MAGQKRLPGARRAAPRRGMDAEQARELLASLRADARVLASRFGLTYRDIQADRPSAGHYGICYEDGLIKIRLQHATRGTPLKYSSLVHTLCHELAHLKHFDHGVEFQAYLVRILEWARAQRIYRPGRVAPPPVAAECGVDDATRREFLRGMRAHLDGGDDVAPAGQLPLFRERR